MKNTFGVSVCLGEKAWKKSGACDYWPGAGQGPGRGQAGQTDAEKGTFTLNSTRLVSGAGSGIVAGSDRVRRGRHGATRGGWCGAGTEGCPRGRGVLTPPGASGGMEGGYWQIFVLCRCSICRCLIELCDDELVPPPDLHQDNPWLWLRGQRSSPGQNEQPAADAPENV